MYKFWSTYEGLILINEDIRNYKMIKNFSNSKLIHSLAHCYRTGEVPTFNGERLLNSEEILINLIN
jgi:hypothetical protein